MVLGRDAVREGPTGNLAAGQAAYPVHNGNWRGGGAQVGPVPGIFHAFIHTLCRLPLRSSLPPPTLRGFLASRAPTSVRGEMERSPATTLDTELRELHFG